jgi:sugar/nucleoside kinase (ribokinase family)
MAEFDVVGVGLNATDTMIVVPRFPPYGGKIAVGREFLAVGGQDATAMIACVRLGLRARTALLSHRTRSRRTKSRARGYCTSMDMTRLQLNARRGLPEPKTSRSPLAAIQRQSGARVAAMTLSACGALAYLEDEHFVYSPGFIVNSIDTTGAGDVFHGAFCYAVLQQMSSAEALEFSNAMAALNCTSFGARGGIATLHEGRSLSQSGSPRREDPGILSRIGTR